MPGDDGDRIAIHTVMEHVSKIAPAVVSARALRRQELVLRHTRYDGLTVDERLLTSAYPWLAPPSRLQALVRKEAPLSVIAELIALLEAAHGGPRLQAADCPVAALTYVDGRLQIDDRGCTACLDCVRPAVRAEYLPPSRLIDDPRQPAQAAGPQGAG